MSILKQWIIGLGYGNQKISGSSYLCNEKDSFLLPTRNLILGFNFPRDISRPNYIEGMVYNKADKIINGIYNQQYLPAIEINLRYDYINGYYYQLKDGYHRYTISRYVNFSHIPVKIVPDMNYYF